MWTYNKVLEYPVNIKCPNPRLAKFIISQYGGPDGELAASLRYLSQRFGMPDQKAKAILNDIGTEDNPINLAESYYLGPYSEKKYQMFLEELKTDNVVFDGKDKQVLRKYSLKLKNTLKRLNAGKENKEDWVKDENGLVIEVVVAG